MRISDWSSDVCSSDLAVHPGVDLGVRAGAAVVEDDGPTVREALGAEADPVAGSQDGSVHERPPVGRSAAGAFGSRGNPSTRSPRMLRWISSVPPAMRKPGMETSARVHA